MADALELQKLAAARLTAPHYVSRYQELHTAWDDWKRRIERAERIYKGLFDVTFPDGTTVTEPPKSPNIVQLATNDYAYTAAANFPSLRCDVLNEKGRARAEKRERIAAFYLQHNKARRMFERYYQDILLAGATFKLVLPDYDKDGNATFPRIVRRDPRWAYPDRAWTPDTPPNDVVFWYKAPLSQLLAQFPDAIGKIPANDPAKKNGLIEVIEYFDAHEVVKVALYTDRGKRQGVTLCQYPNLLKRVPVAIGALPTADGQFRGHFDQVLSVLENENRMRNLLIDEAVRWVYDQPIVHDIENPEDIGTGVVLHKRSREGSVEHSRPSQANPQVFGLLAQMEGSARVSAVFPEGRTGNTSQSYASAAGLNALQANYSSVVAQIQRIEADAWADALSMALETDEKFLSGDRKYIAGSANAKPFSESYDPSKDLKGDYAIRVEYSGAGLDEFSQSIRTVQLHSNQLLSKETAMEQIGAVEDVTKELKLIDMDSLKAAGMAFIQHQAENGNFAPAAAYIAAAEREENPLLVLSSFAEIQQGQSPGQPATGTEAFDQASALSRGGLNSTNVPGVGEAPKASPQTLVGSRGGEPLPPLSSVLLRG